MSAGDDGRRGWKERQHDVRQGLQSLRKKSIRGPQPLDRVPDAAALAVAGMDGTSLGLQLEGDDTGGTERAADHDNEGDPERCPKRKKPDPPAVAAVNKLAACMDTSTTMLQRLNSTMESISTNTASNELTVMMKDHMERSSQRVGDCEVPV